MARLNEMIRDVRQHFQLTLEYMAGASDISISVLHRMELGDREVTARYLRALFRETRAGCLLQWIDHDTYAMLCRQRDVQQPQPVPPPKDIRAILPSQLAALDGLASKLRYVEKIVRDGRIDESDDTAIQSALRDSERVRELLVEADRALAYWREQTSTAKGGQ